MGLIAGIGTAVTAVASSVGIGITATALTVGFTTIAAVGAVVGVVGAVTHNKILSTVGMVLGGIGGIGALASGAGLLGAGGGLLEGASTPAAANLAAEGSIGFIDSGSFAVEGGAAVEGANAVADAAQAAAGSVPGFVDSGSFAGINAAGEAAGASGPGISEALGAGKAGLSMFGTEAKPDAVDANAITQQTALAGGATGAAASSGVPVASAPPNALAPGTSAAPPLVASNPSATPTSLTNDGEWDLTPGKSADSSPFAGILDFANKHPVVALGALQAAGSFISGATNELTPAQVDLYKSQSAANDAATLLVKQQTANLAMPKAVASSAPVSGQAQLVPINARPPPVPSPQGGFINQAPVQSAQVAA